MNLEVSRQVTLQTKVAPGRRGARTIKAMRSSNGYSEHGHSVNILVGIVKKCDCYRMDTFISDRWVETDQSVEILHCGKSSLF